MTVIMVAAAMSGCLQGETPPPQVVAPTVAAACAPTAPIVGETVTCDSTGSDTGGAKTATYAWIFGDGGSASTAKATHGYSIPGDFIVRLSITNEKGTANNDATLVYVRVSPAAVGSSATAADVEPAAIFSADHQVIQKGSTVAVNASASHGWVANGDYNSSRAITPDNFPILPDAGALTGIEWDWGDGSAKTAGDAANVTAATHAYATAGTYTLKLMVTASNGKSGAAGATIVVLGEPPTIGGYKFKDLFVTATISGPQSFDPGFDYETAGGQVIEQVYETLFDTERGNTDKIVALLASEIPTVANGGIKDGGKTYVMKIRKGASFHDGTAVNAAAVKFSLDRLVLMNDPSSGAPVITPILLGAEDYRRTSTNTQGERDAWLAKEAVKVIDEYTIQIKLDLPNAAFFQRLAFYASSVVSPTAFKACHQERASLWGSCQTSDGLPPPGITRDPWADTNAVGTGPFKMRKWLPGDRVIMDRFDGYWGTAPQLKTVIIQYVDDLNTRLLMFKSGDADDIYIASSDLDRVTPSIQGLARFVPADTLIIDAFFFNYDIEDPNECVRLADGSADCRFFQDINVRKAFAHAFNFPSFFSDVWAGRAKDLAGVIPRGMPGYDAALKAYAYDVEKAKGFLADSKGKDGFTVSCYYNSGNNVRKGACELIKLNLEALRSGITVNVIAEPFNSILDKTQNKQIPFWILGWSPDYIATDDYIVPFLHSTGNYPVQQNFKDAAIDAKIDEALQELDPVKQAALFKEINKMAVDKYVDIFLDQRTQTHVERSYVQGYYYSPLHSGSPTTGDYSTLSKA
ncbi:MAG: PKD domain-containing protein [Euryarchaeota archaeon]|nr:PKD domain-containing protein [Euryarchaeota archaeon]